MSQWRRSTTSKRDSGVVCRGSQRPCEARWWFHSSGLLLRSCWDPGASDHTVSVPVAKPREAKALVKAAHLVGTKVSVYGWSQSPGEQQVEYYASVLTSIGFKVVLKIINPSIYWSTIGNVKTAAQTGIAGQFLDFPNPGDFFLLLDARNIHPVNSDNFGNVNDPHLQTTIVRLEQVPASQLASVANQWQLSVYAAQKVLAYTWGSSQLPEFLSNRIDFRRRSSSRCSWTTGRAGSSNS